MEQLLDFLESIEQVIRLVLYNKTRTLKTLSLTFSFTFMQTFSAMKLDGVELLHLFSLGMICSTITS